MGVRCICLALESPYHRNVSDITFSNIHMSTGYYDQSWWGRAKPIYVTTCPRHSKSKEGSISNLLFVNITSTSENGVLLSGSKGGLLSDLRFINLDLTYRRWTNNAGGLVDYKSGCQGLVKHITARIIMEHINGLVIDNVNMRWSDDSLRQWNDPLDFRKKPCFGRPWHSTLMTSLEQHVYSRATQTRRGSTNTDVVLGGTVKHPEEAS